MSSLQFDKKKLTGLERWASVGLVFATIWVIIFGIFMYATLDLVVRIIFYAWSYNFFILLISAGITIGFAITIMLFVRINRIRVAAKKADFAGLKKADSLLWAILGIFLLGAIGGMALLIVRKETRKMSLELPPPPADNVNLAR